MTAPHTPPAPPPPPAADLKFDALGLHPDLLKGIQDLGFERPTPIQVKAIPAILQGRDVIGCAQTGTGKTAAFVLPILHRLMQKPGRGNVRALVVAPTRELALQSMDHLKDLSRYVPLKGAAIFGGVPMEPQITALRQGLDIISATPGRLLDHVYSGRIDFVDLETFVLDEVDRMLDMGFLPDIQRIMSLLPRERQNLVFSATMPPEIMELVRQILRNPVLIEVARRSTPPAGIRHAIYPVPRHLKTELLVHLLHGGGMIPRPAAPPLRGGLGAVAEASPLATAAGRGMTSVLVFARTKHFADRLAQTLERRGFKVSVLHGDRSQSQRLRALEKFREGRNQIMVATDIAARGIDIDDISHVVNFDIPNSPDDYVHRIGRTARAEASGDAFTLVSPDEEPMVADIEKALKQSLPRVTLPNFDYKKAGPPTHHDGHGGPRHGQRHGFRPPTSHRRSHPPRSH